MATCHFNYGYSEIQFILLYSQKKISQYILSYEEKAHEKSWEKDKIWTRLYQYNDKIEITWPLTANIFK
jgi:hypothetical protein